MVAYLRMVVNSLGGLRQRRALVYVISGANGQTQATFITLGMVNERLILSAIRVK
jgi:hypothetical protein